MIAHTTIMQSAGLDSGMRAVLDDIASWPVITTDPVAAARASPERFLRWSRPAVSVESVEDYEVQGEQRAFRVRVYRPGRLPRPPALYIHGGAWSVGSIELADRLCRRLCSESGRLIASVGYALAPEEPYPAGLDDCVDALAWLDHEHDLIGSDGSAPVVVGESSGANLAAAMCLRARAGTAQPIAALVLICPVLGDDFATESHQRWGGGEFLVSSDLLADFWQMYLAGKGVDPFAAPLRARDLNDFPPATIVIAGCDPLRDDGVNFARGLSAAGGSVELIEAPGLLHGFIYMDGVSEPAARTVDRVFTLTTPDELSED
ncbi:MAG TPA: alpha/beta hydrolase [Solirubrobacteraceae bacterium]|jgi:acetyl esterase|nr:alpha/beta hydrolase [Solirubrobacteraceae bacterium]